MTDKTPSPVEDLLERLNAEILAAGDRRDKAIMEAREGERDWWLRSHKMEVANARYVLETADLRAQRYYLQRNMATMNQAKPIAGINLNTN